MASTDLNEECKVDVTIGDKPRSRRILRKPGKNLKSRIVASLVDTWNFGKEDPRRLIHSMKSGVALSLVSLLYLIDPLFNGVGENAIWAVLTVVVVLEFTAGATLSKGLNRGFGTLVAGSLATCVCYVSRQAGDLGEAIILGFSVFTLGAVGSFIRFFPRIKRRYDYGVMIFVLTFSLITVSGYRVDNVFRMARVRLSSIAIGCGVCLVISVLVYPIWAGEDLHNSTAEKYEDLAQSLEDCVREYFDVHDDEMNEDEMDKTSEESIYEGYKSVLDSKATDESLATFAGWEPRHGRFWYKYPWKQYVKIGASLRHLAYSMIALHGCLRSEIQTPPSVRSVLRKPCLNVSEEAANLLRELSYSIRHMRRSNSESMMEHLQLALKDLQAALDGLPKHFMDLRRWHSDKIKLGIQAQVDEKVEPMNSTNEEKRCSSASLEEVNTTRPFRRGVSIREQQQDEGKSLPRTQSHVSVEEKVRGPRIEYAEELPLATFAWLLVESVMRIEHVVEAADELARRAHFRACIPSHGSSRKTSVKVSLPETPRSKVLESHSTFQSTE